jgi:hypothetical protein
VGSQRFALLNAPDKFILFAFAKLHYVFCPTSQFLSKLSFGDIPATFDQQRVHGVNHFVTPRKRPCKRRAAPNHLVERVDIRLFGSKSRKFKSK